METYLLIERQQLVYKIDFHYSLAAHVVVNTEASSYFWKSMGLFNILLFLIASTHEKHSFSLMPIYYVPRF